MYSNRQLKTKKRSNELCNRVSITYWIADHSDPGTDQNIYLEEGHRGRMELMGVWRSAPKNM